MTRRVPDLHQEYWKHEMRLRAAKNRMGPLPGLVVLSIAGAVFGVALWSSMPFFENNAAYFGESTFTFAATMLIMTTSLTGMVGLLMLAGGLQNLLSYRHVRASMPQKPKGYCPEMAAVAAGIEKNLSALEHAVKRRAALKKHIRKLRDSIELDLEHVEAYAEAMRENDIEALTLLSS